MAALAASPIPSASGPAAGVLGLNSFIEDYLTSYSRSHPNIVFAIGTSQDFNIVVYEAQVVGGAFVPHKPLDVYWLKIDPVDVEKNRANGQLSDREELGMLESTMNYGVKTKATGDGAFTVTIPTFPARPFELVMEHGRPRFITPIASQAAVAERAFLETKERLIGSKTVWADLFGFNPETNAPLHERIPM